MGNVYNDKSRDTEAGKEINTINREIMKANELRVGNWIATSQRNGFGEKCLHPYIVGTIDVADKSGGYRVSTCYDADDYKNHQWDDSLYLSEIEGLPLTDDRLKMLGFRRGLLRIKDTDLHLQQSNHMKDEEIFNVYLSADIGEGLISDPDTFIEGYIYVHQLQNLYFSLTGKELINE